MYVLSLSDGRFYAKKQPEYLYSWTNDINQAKVFKKLNADLMHYYAVTLDLTDDGCQIVMVDDQLNVIVDQFKDLKDEYTELLSDINSYQSAEDIPNRKWNKFKKLRELCILLKLVKYESYRHKSIDNYLLV